MTSSAVSASTKEGTFEGFSKRYGVACLVWYERHDRITDAIAREKQVKKWTLRLIEDLSPGWDGLHEAVAMRGGTTP